jgi:hypothetical protein
VIHGANEGLLPALLAFAPASPVATIVHGSMLAAIAIFTVEAVLAH